MSLPDCYNVGICQSSEVGKGGVGYHRVHHSLGHCLAEGSRLGPFKDLVGRERRAGLLPGFLTLHQSPAAERGMSCAYLRGGLRGCWQWRLLHQDVPDVVDPHVALLVPTEHNPLICQDTDWNQVGQSFRRWRVG